VGEDTLGKSFGSGGGRRVRSPVAGGGNGERNGIREKERKKEERASAEAILKIGRQPHWRPSMHLGRQGGWRPPIHVA
jgi:hypothetical protein